MGQQEKDATRTFVVTHEAWWSEHLVQRNPEIMVNGGAWEFGIRYHSIRAIRAEVFDDAFAAFTEAPEVFAALAEQRPTTLDEVGDILLGLGYQDTTDRVNPRQPSPEVERKVEEEQRLRDLIREATAGPVTAEDRARIRDAAGIGEDQ